VTERVRHSSASRTTRSMRRTVAKSNMKSSDHCNTNPPSDTKTPPISTCLPPNKSLNQIGINNQSTGRKTREKLATPCILAARERQLMASRRVAHGRCSYCIGTTGRGSDQTRVSHISHLRESHRSRSYGQDSLGEEAIHVVEREVGDAGVHGDLAAELPLQRSRPIGS
jgi:hypothetical protein